MLRTRLDQERKRLLAAAVGALAILGLGRGSQGTVSAQNGRHVLQVVPALMSDVSPPLRDVPPLPPQAGPKREIPLRDTWPNVGSAQADPVVQTSLGPLVSATTGASVLGVGQGFVGPAGTYQVLAAPPDTNGAVGDTQYVQWVNTAFAVFDKADGHVLYGPADGNTLWDFDFPCGLTNDGDPIVQFDEAAHRWIFTQLSVSFGNYYSCVAVSQTPDALGPYNRYVWQWEALNDYPKLGVWPDGYYMSFNMFKPSLFSYTFVGPKACAMDRAKMLAGAPDPIALCGQLGTGYNSLLPADLDGPAPPSGSPNYFLSLGSNALQLWKFHTDFEDTTNAELTGPTSIGVAAFSQACGGGTCIPQPGTSQQLDSLGDRLMYRLVYRNFGDHEALVANHSVAIGGGSGGGKGKPHDPNAPGGGGKPGGGGTGGTSSVGIRWYELRDPNGTPVVYQQGTFAPDTTSRWMASIALDKVGNIALGYSASSSTVFPEIRYTGREPGDSLGTLQTEATLQPGYGSQQTGLSRWGDYSSISVDPVDGCTFWYTNQYLPGSGTYNWSTRIAAFRFTSCH